MAASVDIAPADLRVVYVRGSVTIAPEDKNVDLVVWSDCGSNKQAISMTALHGQKVMIGNAGNASLDLDLNGNEVALAARSSCEVPLRQRQPPDGSSAAYFDKDFLEEPPVAWDGGGLPY